MTGLWVGCYPAAGIGTPSGLGEGIWRVELDPATGSLHDARQVAEVPAPSFLVADRGVPPEGATAGDAGTWLYAVGEDDPGLLTVLRVDGDRLTRVRTVPSGGGYPCHVAVVGDRIVVANYGDGTLGVLDRPHALAPVRRSTTTGHGPRADRQAGPHAHFVSPAPGGAALLVCDLGTDQMRRFRLEADGPVPDGAAVSLPPGTGPRHLAFAGPHRAYLSAELDPALLVLDWDAPGATGTVVARHPLTGPDALPSHVAVAGDEVWVAVRGTERLVGFTALADGSLMRAAELALPGSCPRHFAVLGEWLVVAMQTSHEVVALDRSGAVHGRVAIPAPACVVPV